jgi:hypothetical protein
MKKGDEFIADGSQQTISSREKNPEQFCKDNMDLKKYVNNYIWK